LNVRKEGEEEGKGEETEEGVTSEEVVSSVIEKIKKDREVEEEIEKQMLARAQNEEE